MAGIPKCAGNVGDQKTKKKGGDAEIGGYILNNHRYQQRCIPRQGWQLATTGDKNLNWLLTKYSDKISKIHYRLK